MLAVAPTGAQQRDPLALSDARHLEWFKEAKFGMFIHWGLYTLLEGSYGERSLPDKSLPQGNSWYAEWIQMRLEVPDADYQALAQRFNPEGFDAEQWIIEAKIAGMRYFVITSKHHDGFALWDSKVSDFTVMHTPFKRDILAELVAACKKHGIKYGFYYSHWQDWEHPNGAMPLWTGRNKERNFEDYWQHKCLPQVRELIENFDPDLLWFDTWGEEEADITPERRDELIALVRKHSDKCLINGRIRFTGPGDHIDFLEMHDNTYPDSVLEKPWQTPATMVRSWGWHAGDHQWKSAATMLGYLVSNASKGGNYLLNIGPKPDGTFPVPAVKRLREMGAWLYANGDAVYGAQPCAVKSKTEGVILTEFKMGKARKLYIAMTRPAAKVSLILARDRVVGCKVLESGMPLTIDREDDNVVIAIPDWLSRGDPVPVIEMTLVE